MPDVPVTLTPWYPADNPPEDDSGLKLTDQGDLFIGDEGKWCDYAEPDGDVVADPQPEWWADHPSPPDMSDPLGPLTVNDMRYALQSGIADAEDDALLFHVSDPNGDGEQVFVRRAARLRRALDRINTNERKDDT